MAINKVTTAPNGIPVSIHKVSRLELSGNLQTFMVFVGSWVDQTSYSVGNPASYNWQFGISLEDVGIISAPDLVGAIEELLLSEGPFEGGQIFPEITDPNSLAAHKLRKNLAINTWRLSANSTSFTYSGKQIACDKLSRGDLDGVANCISLTGNFPTGFPGAWKATDNSFIPLANTAAFIDMYTAMTSEGTANFIRSQALKVLVAQATTIEEVSSINWSMTLPS